MPARGTCSFAGALRTALVAAAVVLGINSNAGAQPTGGEDASDRPRATLRPDRLEGYANAPNELRLIVEGTREAQIASLPEVDGLSLRVGSKQVSVNSGFVINGRAVNRSRVTFSIVAVPTRAGSFTIPPIDVVTGSGRVRTEPATLIASEPGDWEAGEATLRVDTAALVPGQRTGFEIELSFPTTEPVSDLSIESTPPGDALRAELPGRGNAGYARRSFNVELFGQDTFGTVSERRVGRERRTTLTITGELAAVAPGRVEFGPVLFRVARRARGGGLGGSREVVTASTGAVEVEVAPFPEDGKPEGFGGIVGVYRIDASASETGVRVGDPIELTLEVRGPEPFVSFNPPDLAAMPAFEGRFRISPDWRRADPSTYGVRRFETTIRPLRADVDAIPPIEIEYFDPDSKAYGADGTRAIPLEVAGVRRVTAEDAIVSGAAAEGADVGSRAALTSTEPGIWAPPANAAAMAQRPTTLAEAIASPAFAAAVGGPPALAIGFLAFRAAARRQNPARQRRRRALPRAIGLARRGEGARACRSFLADVLDRPAHTVTASDAAGLGLDRDDPVTRTLLEAESARFASSRAGVAPPARDELIAALRRADRAARHTAVGSA